MARCIAIAAITLDGKIALDADHFSDWTSPEDKAFMRKLLDEADVVVVGNNTYKTSIKPLGRRNCIVLTRSVASSQKENDRLLYINPEAGGVAQALESYKSAAVLGGAQTYSYCLENNLLDELYLTVEPLVFGRGIDLFAPMQGEPTRFKLLSMKQLNNEGAMLLHYGVLRKSSGNPVIPRPPLRS